MADELDLQRAVFATLNAALSIPLYTRRAPHQSTGQYLVLQWIAITPDYDMEDETSGVTDALIQIDAYGDSVDEAGQAARAAKNAMKQVRGSLGAAPNQVLVWGNDKTDQRDYTGQQGDLMDNRISQDYRISWNEEEFTTP
ncbi:MAG: hypothetical protein AAGA68_26535 [Pseudomonadota bacterium]